MMKKISFYYSIPTQIRMVPSFADVEGRILGQAGVSTFVKWIPRVVICSVLEGNILSFGFATCSEKDSFVREVGKKIAMERAVNNPFKTVTLDDLSNIKNVSQTIVDEIFEKESKRIFGSHLNLSEDD